jgi:hypothetical protein
MRMESMSSTDCSILFLLNGKDAPEEMPCIAGEEKGRRRRRGESSQCSAETRQADLKETGQQYRTENNTCWRISMRHNADR